MLNCLLSVVMKLYLLLQVLFGLMVFAWLLHITLTRQDLWTAAIIVGSAALFVILERLNRRKMERGDEWVRLDAQRIWRGRGLETYESLRWDELTQVTIMTTDEGPLVEDFFWLLHGLDDEHGIAIGLGLAQHIDLLGRLGRLPGFDFMASVEATGSTQHGRFLCWSGQPGQGRVCGLEAGQDGHLEAPM